VLRHTIKSNHALATLCIILLAINGCSSTEENHLDDPMGIVNYDQNYEEQSQVINEYSDNYQDESLGQSEITSPYAVDEALYGITQPTDTDFYQIESDGMAANLDELTISQNTDAQNDTESYLPDYQDAGVDEAPAFAPAYSPSSSAEAYAPSSGSSKSMTGYGEYVVQPGDTLGGIAFQVLGTSKRWKELSDRNKISDPTRLLPGDIIKYPLTKRGEEFQSLYTGMQTESVTVQRGDTLSQIAERVLGKRSYWRTLWRFNADAIPDPNRIEVGQTLRYVDPNKLHSKVTAKGWSRFGH